MALLKLTPVESRFCSCKRRGQATFDTLINPCARSTCSRSVAVGSCRLKTSLYVRLVDYRESLACHTVAVPRCHPGRRSTLAGESPEQLRRVLPLGRSPRGVVARLHGAPTPY